MMVHSSSVSSALSHFMWSRRYMPSIHLYVRRHFRIHVLILVLKERWLSTWKTIDRVTSELSCELYVITYNTYEKNGWFALYFIKVSIWIYILKMCVIILGSQRHNETFWLINVIFGFEKIIIPNKLVCHGSSNIPCIRHNIRQKLWIT